MYIYNIDILFLVDVFTQISEASGLLNISRFESYLRELLIVSMDHLDLLHGLKFLQSYTQKCVN